MKKLILVLITLLPLNSCWKETKPIETIRPVELVDVEMLSDYQKDFIGTLVPVDEVDLAFAVSGTIESLPITNGSTVKKGQLLAQLSSEEYLLKVIAERESYLTAKSTFERSERLLEKEAISLQDFQITRAKYQASMARFRYAESQLQKTKLTAPYSGSIQRLYVADFQEVQAGITICKLINPNLLEVQFTLPQSDIRMTYLPDSFSVVFEQGISYTARIKEVVDASIDGAGIPVTLSITDSRFDAQKLNIKAGFACTVRVNILQADRNYMVVPLSAIFVEATSTQQKVWVYDPLTSKLLARSVETNGLVGNDDVIISKGLRGGEKVVVAGVYQVSEGQKVKPLK